MKMWNKLASYMLAMLAFAGLAGAQKWQPVTKVPNIQAGAVALLTDGRVLVHDESGNPGTFGNWWTLTPDINGNYASGKWTKVATMPSGYGPTYFGSVVLPDGRYIVEGGEYNDGCQGGCWVNLGAIYDPVKNTWTAVNPPTGWSSIGDAQAVLLDDGTYMQANCCAIQQAYFNPKTLEWTNITNTGKADSFDEEGWGLLPNGDVLTVDAQRAPFSEIYNTATKKWTNAGSTIVRLEDPGSQEVGPFVLRPDGTIFAAGAAPPGSAGHTAIYNTKTKKWKAGPDFPKVNGVALACDDAPSAVEINGNVIVMTSPPVFNTGAVFFEWDGKKLTKIAGPPNAGIDAAFYGHFLELPSGQLLFTDFSNQVEVFTPKGTYNKAWAPTIASSPTSVTRGKTYVVKGTQLSGLTSGAAYGDDFQDSTNYALVRITNSASGHVFYAKTTNPSTYAVQTGTLAESTHFTVSAKTETGASSLVVVTNGIPSAPVSVTVN
jgi:flagellar hook assembly protein FlgD